MRILWILIASCALAFSQDIQLPLMPWPAHVQQAAGRFPIDVNFTAGVIGSGSADARVRQATLRALSRLFRETGIPIAQQLADESARPTLLVVVEQKSPTPQKLGDDESYHLTITSQNVRLVATHPLGALRGLETFLQLVRLDAGGFAAPNVDITDQPRFPWRGLSLDVSRHFLSPDAIKRIIDGLAAVKMNVFHWHLSDDQGFRIESKRFPALQQKGSDQLYYTQAEVREIVAYAAYRGVRVVPEFDIPGHATSWFPGYPNLASGQGPYSVVREPGIRSATMDPAKESTYKFLDGFIGEMAKLFPDAYFHIGGDEVSPKGEWANNPRIAAFMKKNKLANFGQLQAYFNQRVQKIVSRYGKRMVGWDEILSPEIPKSIVIQSWRGLESLADAARQGYSGILSSGYYLDLMQPASQHYGVDPLQGPVAELAPEEQKRILGGEAAMWEELATLENIDVKLWPRLAAIAERFWSPASVTDVSSMYRRLRFTSDWLDQQGMEHRRQIALMQARLGGDAAQSLATFASILEPVKGYARHRGRKYSSLTPFNRLIDSIPPESDAAREFRASVERLIASQMRGPEMAYLRNRLAAWGSNARELRPVLEANALLNENADIARVIEQLCALGLEALDAAAAGRTLDAVRVQAMQETVSAASRPQGEFLIQIAPAIELLLQSLTTTASVSR